MRALAAGLLAVVAAGTAAAGVIAFRPLGGPVAPIEMAGDVAAGAYLARAGGCIACHSREGGAPLAGGAPLVTDFGTFHPPNITPDPVAGIGGWSTGTFARVVRQGVSPDGAPYYPSFPHDFYRTLGDAEVADLHAALSSVPAVTEPAPPHALSFPFDQRRGLRFWRVAFRRVPDTAPVADRSDDWNRGKALAEGLAHCGACHTDRNALGGPIPWKHFAGSDDLPDDGRAPSIRPDALMAQGWTVALLADALESGFMPDGDAFGGAMAEVVAGSTRFLTAADRQAIATYLLNAP